MAAKKGGKSTKTAHVLNLLTAPGGADREAVPLPDDPEAGDTPAEAAEAPEGTESAAASGRPLTPPVLEVARANDEQISEQIRDALESELAAALEAELGGASAPRTTAPPPAEPEPIPALTPEPEPEAASAPEPAPAPQPVPEPQPEPVPAPQPVPEPQPEPATAPQPVPEPQPVPVPAPQPVPAPAPQPVPRTQPEPAPQPAKEPARPPKQDWVVLNVMEKLVELKAPRYISMFGLCGCERCAADVRALTLTNLQPHYITVPRSEAHAMITIFESRFNSTIFAQLTRACKIVMDNPRHDRSS